MARKRGRDDNLTGDRPDASSLVQDTRPDPEQELQDREAEANVEKERVVLQRRARTELDCVKLALAIAWIELARLLGHGPNTSLGRVLRYREAVKASRDKYGDERAVKGTTRRGRALRRELKKAEHECRDGIWIVQRRQGTKSGKDHITGTSQAHDVRLVVGTMEQVLVDLAVVEEKNGHQDMADICRRLGNIARSYGKAGRSTRGRMRWLGDLPR